MKCCYILVIVSISHDWCYDTAKQGQNDNKIEDNFYSDKDDDLFSSTMCAYIDLCV